MNAKTRRAIFWGVLFFAIWTMLSISGRDSTDTESSRSNMSLHNATGCHYLSTFLGGIAPRLDASGQHVCTGHEGEAELRAREDDQ